MSGAPIVVRSPLDGWVVPLAQVPDPVFAQGLAGDGVAIDPTAGVLHAPCDGEVVAIPAGRHAVTVRAPNGADILVHIGIDTVNFAGAGFELLAATGQAVKAGDPLLRFDLDLVARRAPATASPVIVIAEGFVVTRRVGAQRIAAGDFLMEVSHGGARDERTPQPADREITRSLRVVFDHGFHARPAAQVAAALRPLEAEVAIVAHGRRANARSPAALMSLGVRSGDVVEARAAGRDAPRALEILAQMMQPGESAPAPHARAPSSRRAPEDARRLLASIACPGIAVGTAVQWTRSDVVVSEKSAGATEEMRSLRGAIADVAAHLVAAAAKLEGEERAILVAHGELVRDPDILGRADEAIGHGRSAGAAWRAATQATIESLDALADERMRERAADLRDLEGQVLRVLAGESAAAVRELPVDAIVLADELLPSQLLGLDRARLAAVCTARGGATSHVALMASAMGIPALVAAGDALLAIPEGTALVVDANRGYLLVDATVDELAASRRVFAERAAEEALEREHAGAPCSTSDGVAIRVYANLGALAETAPALKQGAEGCGLLRTEFLFTDRREAPDESEQARIYQGIADALDGRTLTIRTLDFGGDKPLAYLPLPHEANPALGLRGLRTSLRHPDLLRTQLRAVLRVAPAGQCRILLPMVTELSEIASVRALLEDERRALGAASMPALGVMIETPASALLADQLVREADFLSIGTNDLSQYALAMDRGHPDLGARLDALHPAVLRLVAHVADAGREAQREVAVCGALGADPVAIPILVGLGVLEISAVPASIPRIKRIVRSLDARACADLARAALEQVSAQAVRALVRASIE